MFSMSDIASGISHSTDICNVAIKNIKDMRVVSTNEIADIWYFKNLKCYFEY